MMVRTGELWIRWMSADMVDVECCWCMGDVECCWYGWMLLFLITLHPLMVWHGWRVMLNAPVHDVFFILKLVMLNVGAQGLLNDDAEWWFKGWELSASFTMEGDANSLDVNGSRWQMLDDDSSFWFRMAENAEWSCVNDGWTMIIGGWWLLMIPQGGGWKSVERWWFSWW